MKSGNAMRLHCLLALASVGLLAHCGPSFSSDTRGTNRYLAAYGGPPGTHHARASTDPGATLPDDDSYWAGDGVSGSPSIRINRREQRAYFYKGSTLVGVSRISTGKEGHDTPPGRYKVTQKSKDHRSNLYGIIRDKATGQVLNDDADSRKDKVPPGAEFVGAPMWNFLRFTGGIGMHTGYLPGYNASHGCVRMPDSMAKKFYENSELGTPVIVE